jgi:hypothetical protein
MGKEKCICFRGKSRGAILPGDLSVNARILLKIMLYKHRMANMGWLEMVNDAFYLIDSAGFLCMEYH